MHRKWKKKYDVVVRTINEYIKNDWQHAGSMLANKSAILIIQQQADTDDNADSDDDFMMTIAQSSLNWMEKD